MTETGNSRRPTAYITGGSSGIGQGIALVLAEAGYDIAVTYNARPEGARWTAEQVAQRGGSCHLIAAALDQPETAEIAAAEAIRLLGRIDVLVCNAGVTRHHHILSVTGEELDFLYNLNYRSYLLTTGVITRHMVENGIRGSVIWITSSRGDRAYPTDPQYGGLKAALKRACESVALQLAPEGIRLNCVAPGATYTRWPYGQPSELARRIPMKRLGTPIDIGNAVEFLCSDRATYITGITLRVDGGLVLPGMPERNFEEMAETGWGTPPPLNAPTLKRS